ncbi:MAG: diphosphate--fructose-6-phosphate 1-phosphotransferase [Candidatus Elarobacter sp.]
MNGDETLAILVGGGPAPGINGVIASATIEARNHGLRVLGIYEGYRHLVRGDTSHVTELQIEDVSRMHFSGGSMLRTSRTNPAADPESLRRCIRSLTMLGVRYLITIGGDDTTFGFETARAVGSAIVENLMEDARTAARWYLAITMGRKSGALALGICKAAGATLAVIPEEFAGERIRLADVVDTIAGAIVKRLANGHDHGVAVIAEGVAERIAPEELAAVSTAERDAYGHVRLADVPLGSVLRDAVRARLTAIGIDATVVPKDIGYELRSAKPIPFDAEYTRTLGYGAVRYLLNGGSGSLIALAGGRIAPVTLEEMLDPATGRIRVRLVDVTTESYEVARKYMIRLEETDFGEPRLSRLAAQTSLGPEEFAATFGRLFAASPAPG